MQSGHCCTRQNQHANAWPFDRNEYFLADGACWSADEFLKQVASVKRRGVNMLGEAVMVGASEHGLCLFELGKSKARAPFVTFSRLQGATQRV